MARAFFITEVHKLLFSILLNFSQIKSVVLELFMDFEIIGEIRLAETFARGSAIRELNRLRKFYGLGNWRKRKGCAMVRLSDGTLREAEIHWYEANGIGKREFKIKHYLDI